MVSVLHSLTVSVLCMVAALENGNYQHWEMLKQQFMSELVLRYYGEVEGFESPACPTTHAIDLLKNVPYGKKFTAHDVSREWSFVKKELGHSSDAYTLVNMGRLQIVRRFLLLVNCMLNSNLSNARNGTVAVSIDDMYHPDTLHDIIFDELQTENSERLTKRLALINFGDTILLIRLQLNNITNQVLEDLKCNFKIDAK